MKFFKPILLAVTALAVIVFYILTIKGVPGNPDITKFSMLQTATKPFESSHNRAPYALTMSLVDRQSFELTKAQADFGAPDVGYRNNKFYILFPPGISIISIPFYIMGSSWNMAQVVTFAGLGIFFVLNMFFLYVIARTLFRLPTVTALIPPLVFGFASSAWVYASSLYQHNVTTFLLLSGLYAVWHYRNGKRGKLFALCYVWFAYGISFFIDYPNLFLLLGVMIYLLWSTVTVTSRQRKQLVSVNMLPVYTIVFFIAAVSMHLYYNAAVFGGPFKFSGALKRYDKILTALPSASTATSSATVTKATTEEQFVSPFSETKLFTGVQTLTVSWDRGLFFFFPVFTVAILGIWQLLKKPFLEGYIVLLIAGINVFVYASFWDPWGGWAYGPRYLIPAMAVLALFVGVAFQNCKWRLCKLSLLPLFLYSSFISLIGTLTTEAVPPKVEADFLKMSYNFFHNLQFLASNTSGVYVFNEFIKPHLTLHAYFIVLWIFLNILFTSIVLYALHEKNN
ncbi:MAG: hypothetical protein WC775_02240 [Patescibacteria group bacterium]|jgi:hypothetical protein